MAAFTFDAQLAKGKEGERIALEVLTNLHWDCELLPDGSIEQRRGIDIRGTHRMSRVSGTWQVKLDKRARDRVAIETIRNDRTGAPGWGYTCAADELLIIVPVISQMWTLNPRILAAKLPQWERQYQSITASNKNYNTISVAVPFKVVKTLVYCTTQLKMPVPTAQAETPRRGKGALT